MNMHATSVLTEDGFGHKGCVNAMLQGDLLHDEAISHGVICHGQSIGVAKINLMLTGCHFMMAVFHMNPHVFQREDGLAPKFSGHIKRRQIEVTSSVEGVR